jgi:putative heme-binding domain-containing protein
VDHYVNSISTAGDLERGTALFKKHCATCHRLNDEGNEVGPDLAALSDKSPRSLLTAILDPNRSIEDRYISYNVLTDDGLVVTGVISEETSNALTLFVADGKQKTILRSEIDSVQSSGISLMPEGFEKELSTDQASDMIAFLQQQTTPRKLFPGNEPRIAPVRNDGSIRLFAVHAQVFGPSLMFEDQYRNLGFWASSHDRAVWELEIPKAGEYSVRIEYACDQNSSGDRFLLTIGDQSISEAIESTGTWDNYGWHSLGTIELKKGSTTAVLRSTGPVSSYLMDYRTIVLSPL